MWIDRGFSLPFPYLPHVEHLLRHLSNIFVLLYCAFSFNHVAPNYPPHNGMGSFVQAFVVEVMGFPIAVIFEFLFQIILAESCFNIVTSPIVVYYLKSLLPAVLYNPESIWHLHSKVDRNEKLLRSIWAIKENANRQFMGKFLLIVVDADVSGCGIGG